MSQKSILRSLLLGCAGLCALGGIILGLHRAAANPWSKAPTKLIVAGMPPLPSLERAIARDPFDQPASPPPNSGSVIPSGVIPMSGPGAPSGTAGMMVPNPGQPLNGPGSSGSVETIQVVGTLISANREPAALVQVGQQTEVLRIGESIGGHRIVDIVWQGIVFADGTRLGIATGQPPGMQMPANPPPMISTPAPSPTPTEEPTPTPAPSASPTAAPFYRPMTIPQPFTSPIVGPPPTVGPPPPSHPLAMPT